MINKFYNRRIKIFTILIFIVLFAFLISYAITAISVFTLLVFFFLDKKDSIKHKFYQGKSNKLIIFYVIFFLIQCIGLFYTTNIEFGIKRIMVLLPVLFLPLVVITEKVDLKLFDQLLNALVIWIIVLLSLFLLIHLYVDERQLNNFVVYYLNDKLGISQFYISFIIVLPLLKVLKDLEKKRDYLIMFKGLILLFFTLLLGNITIFVFLSLLTIFKTLMFFKEKSKLFKTLVLGLVFSFIGLSVFLTPKINEKFNVIIKTTDLDYGIIKTKHSVTFAKNTIEKRIIINMSSLNLIKENFPFGVGTGDFMDELIQEYKKINFKSGIKQSYNNHNQFLSEFTKTGMLGGLCFMFIVFLLLKRATFNSNYYAYFTILFAFGAMVESYLYRQHGVLVFSFFIPLFYSYEKQLPNDR